MKNEAVFKDHSRSVNSTKSDSLQNIDIQVEFGTDRTTNKSLK